MRGVVLVLFAHLVACTDEPPMPAEDECAGLSYIPYVRPVLLSAYSPDHLKIDLNLGSATYKRSVLVLLDYDAGSGRHPPPIEEGGISYCPEFDSSFRVSLDGVEAAGLPGGWTCPGPGGQLCLRQPVAALQIADDDHTPDARLVISDRSTIISIPLGDALLERSIDLLNQSDWNFHPGQVATFSWSPQQDLARYAGPISGALRTTSDSYDLTSVTSTSDTITATLPSQIATGSLEIQLSDTLDASGYSVALYQHASHDASIAP